MYLKTTRVSWVPCIFQAILITFEKKLQEEPMQKIENMQPCEGICGSGNREKQSLREWCKKMKILETEYNLCVWFYPYSWWIPIYVSNIFISNNNTLFLAVICTYTYYSTYISLCIYNLTECLPVNNDGVWWCFVPVSTAFLITASAENLYLLINTIITVSTVKNCIL